MKATLSSMLFFVIIITANPPVLALENSLENRAIQADRYLMVNSPQDIFKDITERTKDSLPPAEQDTFINVITRHLNMDVLAQAMKKSLMTHFTADEISALASFYSMPGSRSAMNKMGVYMADVIPVVQGEMIKAQEKALAAQDKSQEK